MPPRRGSSEQAQDSKKKSLSKKQPVYNGPPAYLLDENRTDAYANPQNIIQAPDGTNLIINQIGREKEPLQQRGTKNARKGNIIDYPKELTSHHQEMVEQQQDLVENNLNKEGITMHPQSQGQSAGAHQETQGMTIIQENGDRNAGSTQQPSSLSASLSSLSPPTSLSRSLSAPKTKDTQQTQKAIVERNKTNKADRYLRYPSNARPDFSQLEQRFRDEARENFLVRTYDEYTPLPTFPTIGAELSNVRAERVEAADSTDRKRKHEDTPVDDYPIPLYDDMQIPPHENEYFGAISGKRLEITPEQYWRDRQDMLRGRTFAELQAEQAADQAERQRDLAERRKKRKIKDDEEMYLGLKNFEGNQRGWNGEREPERQETIQKFNEGEASSSTQYLTGKKWIPKGPSSKPTAKSKAAKATKSAEAAEAVKPVTREEMKQIYAGIKTRNTLQTMVMDDYLKQLHKKNYETMMARPWDPDQIKAEALEERRLKEAGVKRKIRRSIEKKSESLSSSESLSTLSSLESPESPEDGADVQDIVDRV